MLYDYKRYKLLAEEVDRLADQLKGGVPLISGGSPARIVTVSLCPPWEDDDDGLKLGDVN
jgi:hypothetical protein